MHRNIVHARTPEELISDINLSFAKNYISPYILKDMSEHSMYGSDRVVNYIDWGLRARGVFDDIESNDCDIINGRRLMPSTDLVAAFQLGVADGRIAVDDCKIANQYDIFLMKKFTLLFLCEYGDEIIYSRYT